MPIRVQVPGHGIVEFPDGTDQATMAKALATLTPSPQSAAPRKPAAAEDFMTPEAIANRDMTGLDIVKGAAKGLGRSVAGIADLVAQSRMIPGVTPENAGPIIQRATPEYTNDAQRLGGLMEGAAELAVPIVKGVQAIPSVARAASGFQSVMRAAKDIPVAIEAPGQVGLRIMQLAERGGTMPRPVSQFLQRITHPDKAPLTYEEARDFASNISRLSANEFQRLTPVMAREVGELRVVLNKAVADAAGKAGKGAEYAKAMTEYARAMKIRNAITTAVEGAKSALPYASAAGAGYWMSSKLLSLLDGK